MKFNAFSGIIISFLSLIVLLSLYSSISPSVSIDNGFESTISSSDIIVIDHKSKNEIEVDPDADVDDWAAAAASLHHPVLDSKTGVASLFIQPNWTLINKDFKNEPRIFVDLPFHKFTDMYGLIDVDFDNKQLIKALRDVAQTWAKANIFTRFRFSDVVKAEKILNARADAYRYWVTGKKSQEGNFTKWKDDFDNILSNGPGKLGKEEAERVLKRMTEYNGHSFQNWVLNIGRADPSSTVFFHVYTVAYWRWYNGGTTKSRIFVRGGSCHSSRPRYIFGKKVVCQGWKNENEVGDMTSEEFARVLAHEIGHSFHLPHPDSTCQRAQTIEGLQLMRQQRAVTLKDGPDCS